MKILALEHETPGATREQFQEYAVLEARKAWELHQAVMIRELYFRTDRNDAVLILECATTSDAEAIQSKLRLVHAGLIRFELIPLKAYSGFEKLFANLSVSGESSGVQTAAA